MHHITLRLTDDLFQNLTLKAQEKNLSISDTMRECLAAGLKTVGQETLSVDTTQITNIALQRRIAANTLFTYCLIEDFIKATVANGEQICSKAESKAEKLTLAMMQRLPKSE